MMMLFARKSEYMSRATALTRRRDKHTPLDQTRLKAEKKSDDGSGVAR